MWVEAIPPWATKQFILGIHYARRMPCIQHAFGLFLDGECIGICTYGQPASPSLCKGIAGEEHRKDVLELNRLAILPQYNGMNYGSYLVSHSLKMLPNGTYVVSYADWGGGVMSAMSIKPLTGSTQEWRKNAQISFRKVGILATTKRVKSEGNHVRQNIDISICVAQRNKRRKCGKC